ncbi:MAG: hypothetical protein ACI97A_000095 [Planctomycetota bacterium]|jgi:hypothetical protein
MTIDETAKTTKPADVRTPEEVEEYNDQVWDMVFRKVHVVALYVFLQIVLVSFFQTHAAYRSWSGWVFVGQFLGAWTVFYGTLLREMGFRSRSGAILIVIGAISIIPAAVGEPMGWSDATVQRILLAQSLPGALLWGLTLFRWRILKRQYLAAQAQGIIK